MKQRIIFYFTVIIGIYYPSLGQNSISIQNLLRLVDTQHPIAKQGAYYESISNYQLQNANKNWLPQASINAQATYQSAVAGVSIPVANINLASLPKDQYKATIDVSQSLYDGGITASQKQMAVTTEKISTQKTKVDLYAVKQQIINQFINILLCDKQIAILDLTLVDLNDTKKKLENLYKSQYATKASVAQIQSQIIKANQKKLDIVYNRKTLVNNLSILCNTPLDEKTAFIDDMSRTFLTQNSRPELNLFEYQKENAETQLDMIKAKNRPKLNLFAQGGYGRPGLNMLSPYFDFFYIGGVKLSIPISNFYTYAQDKQLTKLQSTLIDNQKEIWLQNMTMQSRQNLNEWEKLNKQLALDDENIKNQEVVFNASKAKFKEDTITLDEYTQSLNDLEAARLNQSVNQIQLIWNRLNARYISGNL